MHQFAKPPTCNLQVGLRRLAAFLSKDMQYMNHAIKFREKYDADFAFDMKPDFTNAQPDGWHRFPIHWHSTALKPVEFMTKHRSRLFRQGSGHLPGVSMPYDSLHEREYIKIFIIGKGWNGSNGSRRPVRIPFGLPWTGNALVFGEADILRFPGRGMWGRVKCRPQKEPLANAIRQR